MNDQQDTPTVLVSLAEMASSFCEREPDASATLVDAAAMIAVSCDLPVEELHHRLSESYAMLRAAAEAVETHGETAAGKSQ